jgi:hypothetical protein
VGTLVAVRRRRLHIASMWAGGWSREGTGPGAKRVSTRDQGAFMSLDLRLLEKSTNFYPLFYYVRFPIVTCLACVSRVFVVLLFESAFTSSACVTYGLGPAIWPSTIYKVGL